MDPHSLKASLVQAVHDLKDGTLLSKLTFIHLLDLESSISIIANLSNEHIKFG